MTRVVSLAFVFGLLTTAASAQDAARVEAGQRVFAAQKCSICHSIAGAGNKKGPLDGVGARLSGAEIRQWIQNAPEMAAKANATRKPAMKAFTTIGEDDLDALVVFLQTLKQKIGDESRGPA